MPLRLFAAQYDSLRQREEFQLSGNMEIFLSRINNATLRKKIFEFITSDGFTKQNYKWGLTNHKVRFMLDLMFVEKVVLTDAQVFDGSFFHAIIGSPDEDDFFKFLNHCAIESQLIEVRLRKQSPEACIFNMMMKEFRFSSIKSRLLSDMIEKILKENSIKDFPSEFNETMLYDRFNLIRNNLDSEYLTEYDSFVERIRLLIKKIPQGIYVINPQNFDWNRARKQIRERTFDIDKFIPRSSPLYSNPEFKKLNRSIVESFRSSTPLPNRSEFLEKTTVMKNETFKEVDYTGKGISIDFLDSIIHIGDLIKAYNYFYNRVLGLSLECNFTEVGNLPKSIHDPQEDNLNDSLGGSFFYSLMEASWCGMYHNVFCDQQCLKIKSEFCSQIEEPDKMSDLALNNAFDRHIKQIVRTVAPNIAKKVTSVQALVEKISKLPKRSEYKALKLASSLPLPHLGLLKGLLKGMDTFALLLSILPHQYVHEYYQLLGNSIQVISNGTTANDESVHTLLYHHVHKRGYQNPGLVFFDENNMIDPVSPTIRGII